MSTPLRVLVIPDRPEELELVKEELERAGFVPDIRSVEIEPDYFKQLTPDLEVVIAHYELPQFGALRALQLLREEELEVPFIVIGENIGEERAVECIKQGAADFLLRDRLSRLGQVVKRAVHETKQQREKSHAEDSLREDVERYRKLVELNPIGIALLREGTFHFINRAGARLLGAASPKQVTEKLISEFARPESKEDIAPLLPGAEKPVEEGFRLEAGFVRLDGVDLQMRLTAVPCAENSQADLLVVLSDITERVKERKPLVFHADLLSHACDAIVAVDGERRITYWNKPAERLYGVLSEEALGGTLDEICQPNCWINSEDEQSARQALDQSGWWRGVTRHVKRSGEAAFVDTSVSLLDGEQNGPSGLLYVLRDVSEQKLHQQSLQAEHAFYHATLDWAPVLLCVLDRQGLIVLFNHACETVSGYSADEVRHKHPWDVLLPEEEAASIKGMFQDVKADEFPSQLRSRWIAKDGNHHLISWSNTALVDGQGTVTHVVSSGLDVTDIEKTEQEAKEEAQKAERAATEAVSRAEEAAKESVDKAEQAAKEAVNKADQAAKEAEQAAQKRAEYFRTLVEDSADMTLVLNEEGKIQYQNPGFQKVTGSKLEDLADRSIVDMVHPKDVPLLNRALEEAKQARGSVTTAEIRIQNQSGAWSNLELTGRSFTDTESVQGTLLNLRDISKRKKSQEKVHQQLELLNSLHAIDLVSSSTLDLQVSLKVILEQVTSRLQADAASVLLFDPLAQTLNYGAGRGFRSRAVSQCRVRLGEGPAGKAALERHSIRLSNMTESEDSDPRKAILAEEAFVAYYASPLITQGELKGVLEVFHRSPRLFDPDWASFLDTVTSQAAIAIDNTELMSRLRRSNSELAFALDSTLEKLSGALDLREKISDGHSHRVAEMMLRMGRTMNISEADLTQARRGALLHDLGKIQVPESILLKPGSLTEEEWEIVRRHPVFARQMLLGIPCLRPALEIPYCHHEKWDGSGYPRGLKGEEIPVAVRIFSLLDSWDSLLSDRPYREAWAQDKTKEHIISQADKHFDPKVVELFVSMEKQGELQVWSP